MVYFELPITLHWLLDRGCLCDIQLFTSRGAWPKLCGLYVLHVLLHDRSHYGSVCDSRALRFHAYVREKRWTPVNDAYEWPFIHWVLCRSDVGWLHNLRDSSSNYVVQSSCIPIDNGRKLDYDFLHLLHALWSCPHELGLHRNIHVHRAGHNLQEHLYHVYFGPYRDANLIVNLGCALIQHWGWLDDCVLCLVLFQPLDEFYDLAL